MTTIELPASTRHGPGHDQTRKWQKEYVENKAQYRITVTARHDDRCKNGHNTFSITADIHRWLGNVNYGRGPATGRWVVGPSGGQVVKHFPELAPYIKWHLCSTDGPLHYIANTLFQAGDKDCWGRRKGEPSGYKRGILVGDDPIPHHPNEAFLRWLEHRINDGQYSYEIVEIQYKKEGGGLQHDFDPKYTFADYENQKWHQCPFNTRDEAEAWKRALYDCTVAFVKTPTGYSEGKEPELEAARRSAIWPDATLEQLQDKAALEARLPALLGEFKGAVESLGFVY